MNNAPSDSELARLFPWSSIARIKFVRAFDGDFWDEDGPTFEAFSAWYLSTNPTGMPELVSASLAKYLRGLLEQKRALYDYAGDEQVAMAFAAQLADECGFVNYGTSLRTAWIEDSGRAWLAAYDTSQGR